MPEIFTATESEARLLREMVADYKHRRQNTGGRSRTDWDEHQAPETYIALTPAGGIFPVMESEDTGSAFGEDDEPSSAVCQIYRLTSGKLNAIYGLTKTVYNLSNSYIPGESWIAVTRDKFGNWFVASTTNSLFNAGPSLGVVTDVCNSGNGVPWTYYPHLETWYAAGVTETPGGSPAGMIPGANTLWAIPIPPGPGGVINGLAVYLTVAGSGAARLGIYSNAGSGESEPDTLVLDAGTVDLSTGSNTLKALVVNLPIAPGQLYWYGLLANTATSTIRGMGNTGQMPIGGMDTSFNFTAQRIGWTVTQAYGALPSAFPSGATALPCSTTAPVLGYKYGSVFDPSPGGSTVEKTIIRLGPDGSIGNTFCYANSGGCCENESPGTGTGPDDELPGTGSSLISLPPICACAQCSSGMPQIWRFDSNGFASSGTCDCTVLNTGTTNLIYYTGSSANTCLWLSQGTPTRWQLGFDTNNDWWYLAAATGCPNAPVYVTPAAEWNCQGVNVMTKLNGPDDCGTAPQSITLYPGDTVGDCNNGGGPGGGIDQCTCQDIQETLYATLQTDTSGGGAACPGLDGLEVEINYNATNDWWLGTGTANNCTVEVKMRLCLVTANGLRGSVEIKVYACDAGDSSGKVCAYWSQGFDMKEIPGIGPFICDPFQVQVSQTLFHSCSTPTTCLCVGSPCTSGLPSTNRILQVTIVP